MNLMTRLRRMTSPPRGFHDEMTAVMARSAVIDAQRGHAPQARHPLENMPVIHR
jgi:hypothetical protein